MDYLSFSSNTEQSNTSERERNRNLTDLYTQMWIKIGPCNDLHVMHELHVMTWLIAMSRASFTVEFNYQTLQLVAAASTNSTKYQNLWLSVISQSIVKTVH